MSEQIEILENYTSHGSDFVHSFDVPHKFPESSQEFNELNNLVSQLYPTGRAFYISKNGSFKKLHDAINVSFLRLIESYKQLIDSSLPDNENFNEIDASFLEYQYGLKVNNDIDLELRKSAIKRKMGHPNNIKARQHRLFIETQLQLSGFDVYVHENTPPYITVQDLSGITFEATEHADSTEHGSSTFHGSLTGDVIANQIEPESYGVGEGNLWASFFIGGENLGDTANVQETRKREFRELVLKLKPAHLAAYLLINYI